MTFSIVLTHVTRLKSLLEYSTFTTVDFFFSFSISICFRYQWPRSLRDRSSAARLLRLWVRIPPGAWISGCCECFVLSGSGLCDELITRPETLYQLRCVVLCDLETSWMKRPWSTGGCCATKKNLSVDTLILFRNMHLISCLVNI